MECSCLLCSKVFDDSEYQKCPVCNWEASRILGDPESSIKKIKSGKKFVDHRKKFLNGSRISVLCRYWEYSDKEKQYLPIEDQNEYVDFGSFAEAKSTAWLDTEFSRESNENDLSVELLIKTETAELKVPVSVPNILEANTLRLGVAIDDEFRISLFVSGGGRRVSSCKIDWIR